MKIDCIGLARSNDTGVDGELGRTTIALLQLLDELVEGQVIIAATNRSDRLDPALLRRFQRQIEFSPYDQVERKAMIERYINSVDSTFLTDEMLHYADHCHTQAETVKFLVEKIIEQIV